MDWTSGFGWGHTGRWKEVRGWVAQAGCAPQKALAPGSFSLLAPPLGAAAPSFPHKE